MSHPPCEPLLRLNPTAIIKPADLWVTVIPHLNATLGVIQGLDRPLVAVRHGATGWEVVKAALTALTPGQVYTWAIAGGANPFDFTDGQYPLDTIATPEVVPHPVRLPPRLEALYLPLLA